MDNISLADIKAVMNDENFNGGGWWILILFIVLFGGGAWGGYHNNLDPSILARTATTQEVWDSQWRQDTSGQLRQITYGIADATYALNNDINNSRYDLADRVVNSAYTTNAAIADLAAQQAKCCCENKTLALENKYDMVNAIHAEGEATRALIQENKIETLQGKINQLELQAALCGVVRYPNSVTYTAGYNPYCNGTAFGNFGGTVF